MPDRGRPGPPKRPPESAGDFDEVSRVFRSSFPDLERDDFRTGSWRVSAPRGSGPLELHHATVLHAFAAAAKLEEKTGITLLNDDDEQPEEHRSYQKLYGQSKLMAAGLERLGVKRGDRVLLVLPTGFEFVLAFFAAQRLGAIPVGSYPPALLEKAEVALERIQHIAAHSQASVCVTNRLLLPLLGSLGRSASTVQAIASVESLLETRATAVPKARAQGRDPAFIQYTSGSTGHPKGVLLSHDNLVSNIHAAGLALQVNRKDVIVSWLPLYHDMGLIGGLLFAFYWRRPCVLLSPNAFLLQPARWLWAIHDHKGTLSPSPNFGYGLCTRRVRPRDRAGLDLSSWRCALNGAEPVNLRTVDEFALAFGPHGFKRETMYPVYGLAESTVAVTFPTPGEAIHARTVDRFALASGFIRDVQVPAQGDSSAPGSEPAAGQADAPVSRAATLVGCGRAVPGHEVGVVDAKGSAVRPGEVGHVLVRGPSLMQGYFEDPKATRAILRDGWLWTGDLGFLDESGTLFITGRAKDIIIVRGKNYYAEDVERVAERVDGVRQSGAVAFAVYDEASATDLVVVVCESKVEGEQERERIVVALSDEVSAECGLSVDEVVLVPPGTLPKTSSGKRQRALCRQRYLEGTLLTKKASRLRLALVFVRSGRGFLSLLQKQLVRRLRAPE
jgi:acyl-CoA synthetase (AMP-forming)/AMP-acid ligase II